MICTFLRSVPLQRLVRPYMATLIDTFPLTRSTPSGSPRGSLVVGGMSATKRGIPASLGLGGNIGGDNRLITAGLEALGELCQVMRQDMLPCVPTSRSLSYYDNNDDGGGGDDDEYTNLCILCFLLFLFIYSSLSISLLHLLPSLYPI
jgi:hypothetical protein